MDDSPAVPTHDHAAAAAPDPVPGAERIGLAAFCVLAVFIGAVTGVGAVVFRDLIGLVHNVFFLGRFRVAYDANVFTPAGPFGVLIILVPVVGSLFVTWITSTFAPEAKGHGVPEVMDAIYYKAGIIRPVVAVVKSIASAVAIGTGAAVGREGPIIQIGSALGSTLGQVVRMRVGQRITLVAAGAGAGIAATFNTPIGGVLFATELMLPEISVDTFMPVALATGTATFVGRIFFGDHPAFVAPATLMPITSAAGAVLSLALYAVLGAVIGCAAAGFVRGLHVLEDAFDEIPNRYLRHALGMLMVGVLIYVMLHFLGHYYVEGVGYATIQAALGGGMVAPWLFLLLFAAKLFATSTSLGSGSSGGIFSPSLYMGGMVGGAFASLLSYVLPDVAVSVPAFVMVGMGAMVGSGTGAAMTAVAMIFEMTRDYEIVLPMILAVAVALGTRRLLSRENIYTLKLVRRGHPVPKALHANMFLVRSAADVMERDVLVLDAGTLFGHFIDMPATRAGLRNVVVMSDGVAVGTLRFDADLRSAMEAVPGRLTLGEVANPHFITVRASDVAFGAVSRLTSGGSGVAIVLGPDEEGGERVLGVITRDQIAGAVASSLSLYP